MFFDRIALKSFRRLDGNPDPQDAHDVVVMRWHLVHNEAL